VFNGGEFRLFLAGGHQADVVLAVSPVEANDGSKV
jgi:hypothetical protein